MSARDIIVIGASSGGLQAVGELVRGLPVDTPAALFVVIHTSSTSSDVLAGILERAGRLPAATAENGDTIRTGRIYVAKGDHHLLLEPGRVRLARGPKQNGFRPAVDPLFRTAAEAYGPRVIGVVLSGALDDGTVGLDLIKRAGGRAVVQEPADALVDSMPLSAIRHVGVDHVLPAAQMGILLSRLVREPVSAGEIGMSERPSEPEQAEMQPDALQTGTLEGPPSPHGCPECGGTPWESETGELLTYDCHTGHGFTAESLVAAHTGTLEEHAALQRRMADHARRGRLDALAQRYDERMQKAKERSALIRQVLMHEQESARIGEQPL